MKPRHRGFTLIELMIVASIIGILASVAIPKFAQLLRKSQEGTTKGNLGALRSILSIYYADNEGLYPTCVSTTFNSSVFTDTLIPKYSSKIPNAHSPGYHQPTSAVICHMHGQSLLPSACTYDNTLGAGWTYTGTQTGQYYGALITACSHTDTKGTQWRAY